jgi:hypothetical protein
MRSQEENDVDKKRKYQEIYKIEKSLLKETE